MSFSRNLKVRENKSAANKENYKYAETFIVRNIANHKTLATSLFLSIKK